MKYLILAGALLALAGCAETANPTKPITISSKPIARPELDLPKVDQYQGRNVEWVVITPENAEEKFAELESRGEAVVLFAVTEKGYERLALNNREALNVMVQQRAVINAYRRYYIRVDGAITQHNKNLN